MKAVVAMDSFKGSLTSLEAGEAVREGILRAMPDARVTVRPLADGGEGTVEALTAGMGGRREWVTVTGPIGRPVEAVYGILDGGRTAVMEMSAAAGMLQALGFSLLDRAGRQVEPGARGLAELAEIRDEGALPELRECSFRVACDVTNPLCGERGASAVYGPQKGAGPAVIAQMDRWLADYAALCRRKYPRADPDRPGTGAAGGLGFAFLAFTDARLEPGAEIVLAETGLESYVREADVLVTGEGRLDGQSAMGKAPVGAAKAAKRYGKLTVAFSGCVGEGAEDCNRQGIDAFFPILRGPASLEEAMDPETARRNLAGAAEQAFRLLVGGRGLR